MCQRFSKREEIMHVELNLTFANKFHSMSLVRYLMLGLFVSQFAVLFGQDTMAVHTPFSSNVINVKNETSDIGFSGKLLNIFIGIQIILKEDHMQMFIHLMN